MAQAAFLDTHRPRKIEQGGEYEETQKKYNEMLTSLPKARGWSSQHVLQYQGFWLNPEIGLKGTLLVQNHFKARPTDILLASSMKSGTTWLRALMFATMNRYVYDFSSHPLLNRNPQVCFPFLDGYNFSDAPISDLEALPPSPRLLGTHIPYSLLPESVTTEMIKRIDGITEHKFKGSGLFSGDGLNS